MCLDIRQTIYKIMNEKSMCQAAVARRAGYTPKKFNDMLRGRGRIDAEVIAKLCPALGVDANELFEMRTDHAV